MIPYKKVYIKKNGEPKEYEYFKPYTYKKKISEEKRLEIITKKEVKEVRLSIRQIINKMELNRLRDLLAHINKSYCDSDKQIPHQNPS